MTAAAAAISLAVEGWETHGRCRQGDVDTNVLFPVARNDAGEEVDPIEDPTAEVDYSEALALCAVCPVREHCLDYALENNLTDGVWGGTTPETRAAILKHYRMVAHGEVRGYTSGGCREQCCKDAMAVYFADRRHPIEGAESIDGHHKHLAKTS